ncbi:nucleotidyltransferase domain-containing protein [Gryllotalpicola protaetiae]|uniref:Nucleotidyltransferase domain-containing protein n=2 Tax=Gryllotalpicola protaetiae TaxID=2419771 RepID=A0A387BHQ1_9MICO|nr:nucleotidyltransferase domain-containing protein [Gryllotalpicola protaetiae]
MGLACKRTPCNTEFRDPLAADSVLAAFACELIDPACKENTLLTSDHAFNPSFVDYVADSLYRLPGVEAVALGGSRAQGTHHADSDWDVAVYYRGGFDPQSIRDLGWPGQISELGAWSPIFNGGGKLTVDGHAIDIHYRDLHLIDQIHDDACRGEYSVERLLFHQAGLPSYILLAELGINRTLRGSLSRWEYPEALRRRAPGIWWEWADFTFQYAEEGHARHGRAAQCAGLLSEGACYAAHAILAHRGEWVTNEKQLLTKAGLRWLDEVITGLDSDPQNLSRAVIATRKRLADAVATEGIADVHHDGAAEGPSS